MQPNALRLLTAICSGLCLGIGLMIIPCLGRGMSQSLHAGRPRSQLAKFIRSPNGTLTVALGEVREDGPMLTNMSKAASTACKILKLKGRRVWRKLLPPTLLYLGFAHVGSTTLATVLNHHMNVSFGSTKEHSYLCRRANTFEGYLREFYVPCSTVVSFDTSPMSFTALLNESHPLWPKHKHLCERDSRTQWQVQGRKHF
eukprot:5410151-Amphidinium_carterae.2